MPPVNNSKMDAPSFHEFKKQASVFLKEKIKTARLALTDVTPAQLLAEEATNGNLGGPEAQSLKMISKAAFDVDDYWRIVGILRKRLGNYDKRNWRPSYKALIVLEYLLTHGPGSVSDEFQGDRDAILEMERFQHIDERGFNWGLNVRKKCERVLKLLEKGPYLKEERDKARKISRGIEGFGSFNLRMGIPRESSVKAFDRCNSQFNDHTVLHDFQSSPNESCTKTGKPLPDTDAKMEDLSTKNISSQPDSDENRSHDEKGIAREEDEGIWNFTGESRPLMGEQKDESRIITLTQDHHPFVDVSVHLTAMSLLSTAEMSNSNVEN